MVRERGKGEWYLEVNNDEEDEDGGEEIGDT